MTWPFENDTSAITKKLAKRNLKADKSRNILIIITIALATCLIMTTTLYFFASQRKSLNDAAGRYQAIINEVDNDTITKLVNDSRVQVGVSHLLGLVSYGDYKLTVRSMDETLMKLAKYPDLEGELPKSTNEIAITKAFLDRAGLSKSVGDIISLNLGDGEKDYTLCGILPVENSNYSVFVSQSYIENKLSEPAYSAYIRLNESDGWSKAAIQAELSTLCRELKIQPEQMQFSTYYFSLIEQRSSQYITVIAFISLIIALACTLVIYSLFYVSIARKTKEYGKLRTIGATGKQMKRIVFREGFHLSKIGIPIGILAGAIAGYVLVPQGWNTLMVFVIAAVTALFVYLCVMIAVIKPAKIAAHVTPIEAVRYMASNRMPVYIFVMFIGVFGIINLLNTLITNILTRKRELGVLQAVGLSSKQLSKMLLIEGLFYTLGVLLLSISCGTLIGYLLCTVFSAMSIFGKVSYHFPTVEMFSYFILMLAVQMLFSYLAIRQIKKQSLVDQIRELS